MTMCWWRRFKKQALIPMSPDLLVPISVDSPSEDQMTNEFAVHGGVAINVDFSMIF